LGAVGRAHHGLCQHTYISFIGIRTLCDSVTRGYGDHSPLTVNIPADSARAVSMAFAVTGVGVALLPCYRALLV